ncbi:MAG TPA: MBL fold metallo-hydrolase, partial [Alphaproteobacteria bacterium]|nr:MBL fold metallo-hydrolase [Alphaproteobacteria bacterium]
MSISFETLGNATILMFEDGKPQFATDPWMTGTAYYGSWALENPLSASQIENIKKCKYIWFSHGHPDHLHIDSIDMLDRGTTLLV